MPLRTQQLQDAMSEEVSILEVSQQHLLKVPGVDHMPVVRILFSFKETVTNDLQALFITIQLGEAQILNDFLHANKALMILPQTTVFIRIFSLDLQ